MVADVEGLWFGDDEEMTPTSGGLVALEVVGAMTDRQISTLGRCPKTPRKIVFQTEALKKCAKGLLSRTQGPGEPGPASL